MTQPTDSTPDPADAVPLDALADDEDDLGWRVEDHGRMREHAAPDDAVSTVRWDG